MDEWNRLITNIAGGLVDWLTDCWTNGTGRRTYQRTNMRTAVVGMDRVMGCTGDDSVIPWTANIYGEPMFLCPVMMVGSEYGLVSMVLVV